MYNFYSNVGKQVCTIAEVCGLLGVACVIIGVLMLGSSTTVVAGLIVAVSGILAIVWSFVLYAFGQIAEDIHAMRNSGVQGGAPAESGSSAPRFTDLPEL